MAGEGEVDKVTPIFWGLFSVGGFVVAFLLPVFILMNNLAYAFWIVGPEKVVYEGELAFVSFWLTKIFLVVLVGGCLFHGMHRLKYILYDLGLVKIKKVLEPVVYGIAAAGTVAAVFLAFSF